MSAINSHLVPFNIKNYTFIKMKWTEFIGGAAMATILKEAFSVFHRIRRARKAIPSNSLLKVNDIYEKCMRPVLESTAATGFTISKIENSGGPLLPGADVFVSITNEDYQKPMTSLLDMFQRWRADKTYIDLLRQVIEKGSVAIEVVTLPDESRLKNVYLLKGIKYVEIYFIAQTKIKIFIASIATQQETKLQTPADRAYIDQAISTLRNIFAEYYKE